MAWPNPFRASTPNTRSCWGYSFEWTPDHLSEEETRPMKLTYDKLAEECLTILDGISPPPRSALPRNSTNRDPKKPGLDAPEIPQTEKSSQDTPSPPARDLYILLRDNANSDPTLKKMWDELNTVPPWVDWAQIERGQDVFYRYGGPCLTGLAYQSLLGGMGAARVVETLARTGGFSTKVARNRLFETTQHILQCTRSLESIQPGGEGFASTIRVRLLHAAVRRRILGLAESRPSYYSVADYGIPINDLDSIATIATFSSTLIWLSLPRQGLFLRQAEILDYIALWRYIAHLIGCPTDPFATPALAKAHMDSLLLHEIAPTETSKVLANNIIRALDDQPPGFASAEMLTASARWLNGNELGDALGLQKTGWYYWMLIAGQCCFFCVVCYTYRSFERLDRQKIDALKRVFWAIIVESKYGLKGKETGFEMQYVPEYDTISSMKAENDGAERKKDRSVERRNLKWALIGSATMLLTAYVGWKVTSGLVGLVVGLAWR